MQGLDFRVRVQERPGTLAVIALHGYGIEPGTSEVAEAIAGNDVSFYAFEGIKSLGNGDLHITSTRFDEPLCMALIMASSWVINIHGENSNRPIVFLGGREGGALTRLRNSLTSSGFNVDIHNNPSLQGCDLANVCNRGISAFGVQLELSKGLRRSFFESLSRVGRQTKTTHFNRFVTAVRDGIL